MYALSVQCVDNSICMFNWNALSTYAGHSLSGIPVRYTSEQSCRTGITDSVWREKLTCHVASGDLTTFENLIISIGQESKPDVFLEVSSGIATRRGLSY